MTNNTTQIEPLGLWCWGGGGGVVPHKISVSNISYLSNPFSTPIPFGWHGREFSTPNKLTISHNAPYRHLQNK